MDSETTTAEPRRLSRKGLYIPIMLMGIVCLIWTGVWFFARSKTSDVMDAWIAREETLGRSWTCPDRAIDGFPFRIQVSCTNPTFTSREPGRIGSGSLGSLGVVARVVDPKNLIAGFGSPLKWQAEVGDSVELTFETGRASYRGTPGTLDQMSFEFEKPAFTYKALGLEPFSIKSVATEFHLRRASGAEEGTDLVLTSRDIASPALNFFSGEEANGTLDIRATVAKLLPVPPKDWKGTLEAWRLAGGDLKIERFNFSKGPIALNSAGILRLDETRRLNGALDGTAQGVQQILARMGVNIGGGAGGGLLGALLSGGKPGGQARPLPLMIRFDQGRVFFGPIPGPRLLPLY